MKTWQRWYGCGGLAVALALVASTAQASFHLMQIEQVMAGFCGDVTQQAIQLRMRNLGQNFVSGTRLVARDAAGANPITLLTFSSNVTNSAAGTRILVATSGFASAQAMVPDFTMTNRIPPSYFAAGRLSFEDSLGGILWSVSWGGASYTGPNTGTLDNDADGNFAPAFGSALPFNFDVALRFPGAATALSTNNAADYAFTAANAASFTNNAGVSVLVVQDCLFGDGFDLGDTSRWSVVVP